MSESIVDTLMGFREHTVSQDFFLRSVLRHPRWHIPVDRADHPVLWTLGEGGFVAAQAAPVISGAIPAGAPQVRRRGAAAICRGYCVLLAPRYST